MDEFCEISGARLVDRDPIKTGDRVRLIGYAAGGIPVDGRRGTVAFFNAGTVMQVAVDQVGNCDDVVTVFVSQVIKLKPQGRK